MKLYEFKIQLSTYFLCIFVIKVSWLAKTTVINILAAFFSNISFRFNATFV